MNEKVVTEGEKSSEVESDGERKNRGGHKYKYNNSTVSHYSREGVTHISNNRESAQ